MAIEDSIFSQDSILSVVDKPTKCSTPNGKLGVSNNFTKIQSSEISFSNLEKEIIELKDKLDKVNETVSVLQNENIKLQENICSCSCTTEPRDINKASELFILQHKKLSQVVDKRITNCNKNINIIQLENKQMRK